MGLKKLILSLPLALSLSGCFAYMVPGENFKGRTELPQNLKEYYHYEKREINYTTIETEEKEKYTIKTIQFPSAIFTTSENSMVTVDYYDLNHEEKTPLIIISPILGGSNKVSEIFAEYFTNHNLACAIVHRPNDKIPRPYSNNSSPDFYSEGLEKILKQSIIDTMRTIDLLTTFPDIDEEKIGSLGVSLGAIKNATLAGIEKRLKANVIILGGCDIPYILFNSTEEGIVEELQDIFKKVGSKNLMESLKKNLLSDPRNLAKYMNDETTLMFIALFDTVVPTRQQEKLRDLIGNPDVIYLWGAHYTSAFYILPPFNYVQRKSLNFFREQFGE